MGAYQLAQMDALDFDYPIGTKCIGNNKVRFLKIWLYNTLAHIQAAMVSLSSLRHV